MSSPYSGTPVNGYNANPPPDDSSTTAPNLITWAGIKSKLADPLNTFASAIDSNLTAAFGKTLSGASIASTAVNYPAGASDQGRLIRVTVGGKNVTTPDATVVHSPFVFAVLNNSSGLITVTGNNPGVQQTIDGSNTVSLSPGAGIILFTDGTNWYTSGQNALVIPRSYLVGCTLSNDVGTPNSVVDIAAGLVMADDNVTPMQVTAINKTTSGTWVVGNNSNGLDAGSVASSTWYHVYIIKRIDTNVVDALLSTSASSPTLPANYTKKRRIGSILTDGSSNILAFIQLGDQFLWNVPVFDISTSTQGTNAVLYTMSAPLGVQTTVFGGFAVAASGGTCNVLLTSPDQTNSAATSLFSSFSTVTNQQFPNFALVRTDLSSRIRARSNAANTTIQFCTQGYYDRRGQDT